MASSDTYIIHQFSNDVKSNFGKVVLLSPERLVGSRPQQTPPWLKIESILSCSGWCRVSDPKQTEGYSLKGQQNDLRKFALLCCMEYRTIHRFPGVRVRNRKLTGTMIAAIQEVVRTADVLLVTSLDRLTRRAMEEIAERIEGNLYVCPLDTEDRSHAIKRSLRFR